MPLASATSTVGADFTRNAAAICGSRSASTLTTCATGSTLRSSASTGPHCAQYFVVKIT